MITRRKRVACLIRVQSHVLIGVRGNVAFCRRTRLRRSWILKVHAAYASLSHTRHHYNEANVIIIVHKFHMLTPNAICLHMMRVEHEI